MKVLEQEIDGIRYRSSLEARWAIFFREAGAAVDYEPEGFIIGGRPYRPDFLLRDCGTWVEVKGDPDYLDQDLMQAAALELPRMSAKYERGPRLLILGPVPELPDRDGDFGWLGLSPAYPQPVTAGEPPFESMWCGFGSYYRKSRPWYLEDQYADSRSHGSVATGAWEDALSPVFDPGTFMHPDVRRAYFYARAYRFGR